MQQTFAVLRKGKAMTDYIKREERSRTFTEIADDLNDLVSELNGKIVELVKSQSADVAPVRHGHWRLVSRLDEVEWLYGVVIECSQCKHKGGAHYNYCPNCGAKMDEGE